MRIKTNDTFPNPAADLSADITGASVSFRMWKAPSHVLTISNGTVVVDDAANGLVHYAWAGTDTATPGIYQSEFRVVYGGGAVQRFPQRGYLEIVISPAVA